MLQLSDEDQAEFREIFGLVDTDGSGKISPSELGQLTKKLGLNYTEVLQPFQFHSLTHLQQKQLEQMVREIDIDRSGEIDFDGKS
jgi:Ca2+-binding EF-hand superfamily protein